MPKDFTLKIYAELLEEILKMESEIYSLKSYFDKIEKPDSFIIIRHDVDRKPHNALKMAHLENSLGISSTYYFRFRKKTFNKEIIRRIIDLGHEIGYHYEVIDKAKGDIKKSAEIFKHELGQFRLIYNIKTACMHGNPLSKWDNRDFWNFYGLSQFALSGEAYLSIKDLDLYYLTDTGRGWNNARFNIKDTFPLNSLKRYPPCNDTRELIHNIRDKKIKKIYLQIHPNRWSWNQAQWILQWIEDSCLNILKIFIFHLRKKG